LLASYVVALPLDVLDAAPLTLKEGLHCCWVCLTGERRCTPGAQEPHRVKALTLAPVAGGPCFPAAVRCLLAELVKAVLQLLELLLGLLNVLLKYV
jgi:hypothetical protein